MLQEIKNTCEFVSNNSKHVYIDEEKLKDFAHEIDNIKMDHWLSSSPFGLLDLKIDTIVNFLLIFESIDFSFWGTPKWEINTPKGKFDGSIALLYSLLEYVKINNTTDFSEISDKQFLKILKGNVKIPLFEERLKIVRTVSKIVNEKMNGNFYEFIKTKTIDVDLFSVIIENFPCFKDERRYGGRPIYFYKLAQLLTNDILFVRNFKENIQVDFSHLVGCADYKIPQVLRGLKILTYDDELSRIVDNQVEIEEDSIYEIEIRANMITVICKLKKILNNKFSNMQINDYIFMQKSNKEICQKPYHLTRNTNY